MTTRRNFMIGGAAALMMGGGEPEPEPLADRIDRVLARD